jgi:uncharacterized membrane protein YhiD involved in acid resistance
MRTIRVQAGAVNRARILSGMGFIGAGAIVRKGSLTTAATLWFVTVLGLCFGGGQIALGLAVLALGVLVLGGLKRLESRWKQDRHATLSLKVDTGGPTEDELTASLKANEYEIRPWAVTFVDQGRQRLNFTVNMAYSNLQDSIRFAKLGVDLQGQLIKVIKQRLTKSFSVQLKVRIQSTKNLGNS